MSPNHSNRDSASSGGRYGDAGDNQSKVLGFLKGLHGIEPLKQLFWSQLNYARVNTKISRTREKLPDSLLAEDPILFAEGGDDGGFKIIYGRLAQAGKLLLGAERQVVSKLLTSFPNSLFVFSDAEQERWHFLNVKDDPDKTKRRLYRRITIGPEERLRTASERIAMLDLAAISPDLFGLTALAIQKQHDDAFDVELVTKRFYEGYKAVFDILQADLQKQTRDKIWAHDYALQFLNRCMFLYFVQRKRWLGNDTEFLSTFWREYKRQGETGSAFFEKWLRVLFFEAFNNKSKNLLNTEHRGYLPEPIRNVLMQAPYLNGGLFEENDLDKRTGFTVSDSRFEQIYKFLENYNFTIAEDSPLDQEVAVDPEMIGKVYESLVNVSTEADERGDAGIFYTPRTEIDLMCRLSLVDNMTNHLGSEHKNLLYEVIFALEPEEHEQADAAMKAKGLWPAFHDRLKAITVVDPACGSGSFLVGMLNILDDLQKRAESQLDAHVPNFDRKKQIIGKNLYGVDVMAWACHVAELRLWLALIIDAEFTQAELHARKDPLLPHFSFKIRQGDSLVQEVGGVNLGHIRGSDVISATIKSKVTKLKNEKYKFYNHESGKFQRAEDAESEELNLFREILDVRGVTLQEEQEKLKRRRDQPVEPQMRLDGTVETKPQQLKLDSANISKRIDEIQAEIDRVAEARQALNSPKRFPFVWDIAFVEIFSGDEHGFDVVIGNPPYVRQENISEPLMPREKVTADNKKAYKAKLARSVYQAFPRYFGYKQAEDRATKKLNAKSDLYIYFYFHGLSLLNSNGTFCFITSNSWLDVGYGSDLQEFLLQRSHVKLILDNQVKRSFASADVNTIIALFSAPVATQDDPQQRMEQSRARFVMLKVPFEHVLSAVIFEEIEEAKERKTTPDYRVFPIGQDRLFTEGLEAPEEDEDEKRTAAKASTYAGNKWGGKYLRAPEIYWTILEKGKGKLVRLGDIAEVRFGIKTGANEFFYLDAAKVAEWGIEEEFIVPVIKSAKDSDVLLLEPSKMKTFLFYCHKEKSDLKKTKALEYIKWGEDGGIDEIPSVRGRRNWYDVGSKEPADAIILRRIGERCPVFEANGVLEDCVLFGMTRKEEDRIGLHEFLATLNSTWTRLYIELMTRQLTGAQAVADTNVYIIREVLLLNTELLPKSDRSELARCYREIRMRPSVSIFKEATLPDRRALDDLVFDVFKLTKGERDAVYEAVIGLVEARLSKADSLDPKKLKKRADAAEKLRGIWLDQPDDLPEE